MSLVGVHPGGQTVLIVDVHPGIGNHAHHRQAGKFLQLGKAGAQNVHIAPEFADDQALDPLALLFVQQRHCTIQLSKYAAPVDIACQQHRLGERPGGVIRLTQKQHIQLRSDFLQNRGRDGKAVFFGEHVLLHPAVHCFQRLPVFRKGGRSNKGCTGLFRQHHPAHRRPVRRGGEDMGKSGFFRQREGGHRPAGQRPAEHKAHSKTGKSRASSRRYSSVSPS